MLFDVLQIINMIFACNGGFSLDGGSAVILLVAFGAAPSGLVGAAICSAINKTKVAAFWFTILGAAISGLSVVYLLRGSHTDNLQIPWFTAWTVLLLCPVFLWFMRARSASRVYACWIAALAPILIIVSIASVLI